MLENLIFSFDDGTYLFARWRSWIKWNLLKLSILYICPQFAICHQILWFIDLRARARRSNITIDFVADLATRKCSTDGFWISEDGLEAPDPSWTNFTGCFTADVAKVIDGYYGKNSSSKKHFLTFSDFYMIFFNFSGYFYTVAYHTRIFEMVGYSVSFVSILASLCILSAFR